MPVTAIVGAQWGDEGKGKITDVLAHEADMVIRFGGGSNAGHTVVNDHGEFALHLIPCGIFNPSCVNVIGTGAVVDFESLDKELDQLNRAGINAQNLRVSSRAHLVMPYHRTLDALADDSRGSRAIGTTRRGVGPAYVDKANRMGLQAADLLNMGATSDKLHHILEMKNRELSLIYHQAPVAFDAMQRLLSDWSERYGGLIVDQVEVVGDALARDDSILLEGQLGALRDLDWGIYPYVTSSTTITGGATVGGGIPASRVTYSLGVVKAYTTAVGAGPIPCELDEPQADELRRRGGEYGATTGRPRRIGWFDAVATRYANLLNGFSSIAVTKLDVLDGMATLQLCTGYLLDGTLWKSVPATPDLSRVTPQYEEMPGWSESTGGARKWNDLPINARAYLRRIEELVGAPIGMVSVGQARDEIIRMA